LLSIKRKLTHKSNNPKKNGFKTLNPSSGLFYFDLVKESLAEEDLAVLNVIVRLGGLCGRVSVFLFVLASEAKICWLVALVVKKVRAQGSAHILRLHDCSTQYLVHIVLEYHVVRNDPIFLNGDCDYWYDLYKMTL
jgi:hypothetical protein